MKMNLFEIVRDQHAPAATAFLGELLGQKPELLRGGVDSAIGTVLDGFASVAKDHSGREVLYEAIRYSDEELVKDPAAMFRDRDSRDVFVEAGNRLTGLVGISNKEQMVATLQSRAELSGTDAENMLGYVTPGVMGVLKGQISKGEVLDNPDGIGQMFLGEGDIKNVDTTKKPLSGGQAGNAGSAITAAEGSDMSWLVRYTMPVLLLGGLVLGGLNNCGNQAEQRIVADQRSKLQTQLDTALAESDEARGRILSLQSDFDAAKSQTTELTTQTAALTTDLQTASSRVSDLEGELATALAEGEEAAAQSAELSAQVESLTAELDTAKASVVELEEALALATSKGEESDNQNAELTAQATSLSEELEATRGRVTTLEEELASAVSLGDAASSEAEQLNAQAATLTADLEAAKTRIVDLQGQLDTALSDGDAAKAEVDTANAGIESAQAELAALNSQTATLSDALEMARSRVTELEGELISTRAEASSLRGQVQSVTAELNQFQDLPAETSALQGLLSTVTTERDSLVDSRSVLNGKLQTAINERNFAKDKIARLESELGKAVGEVSSRDEKLQQLEALQGEFDAITAARDEASQLAGQLEDTNADLQQQLDRRTREVGDLEARLRTSTERLAAIDTRLSDTTTMFEEEKSSREADVARLTSQSGDLQNKLTEMLGLRDQAVSTLSMRDSEVTSLGEKVNALQGEIETLEAANAAAAEEAAALQQQIEALNGDLENTASKVSEANETLAAREESLVAVNEELNAAMQSVETVSAERDELMNKRDALASRVKELMVEKDAVIAETVELNGTIDSLNGELESARQSGVASENKLGLLNESMSGLQKELRLITGARDEASDQARTFRTQVNDLKKQVAQLESDLASAKTAHDEAMQAMQSERETERQSMLARSDDMNARITGLGEELTDTMDRLQQATTDLAALNEEKAAAMAEIDALQNSRTTLQSSLEAETGKVGGLETTLAMLESDKTSLTSERDDAMAKISTLSEEVETLTASLQSEQSTVGQLNDTIDALKAANEGVTSERDEARGTVASLEAELDKSLAQVSTLDNTRQTLQSQVDNAAAMAQAQIDGTLAVRDEISGQLAAAGISSAAVSAIEDDSAVAITLGSGDLYGIGSARLSPTGTDLLGGVGDIIANYPGWRIDVEGHTDSQGIGEALRRKYPTNWELSTARASAAVRYLSSRAGIEPENISARGFADTQPVASNETSDGREQNRRVEIILRR